MIAEMTILNRLFVTLLGFVFHLNNMRFSRRVAAYLRWAKWHARLGAMGCRVKICGKVVIRAADKVKLGEGVVIAEFVHIWGGGGVVIGNDVIIASHVAITSQTHDVQARIYKNSSIMKEVVIEDNVWIGSGAVVLPGVHIGKNSVVGAGAVVTKDVPRDTVVMGVPARVSYSNVKSKVDVIF